MIRASRACTSGNGTKIVAVARLDRASHWLSMGTVALITIATLLFGAVHPWAYRPLGVVTVVLAAGIAWRSRGAEAGLASVSPAILVLLPPLLQSTPIPHAMLEKVAPSNVAYIKTFEVGFGSAAFHSLSVVPTLTVTSWTFLLVLTIWMVVMSRAFETLIRPCSLVPWLIAAAVLLSLLALIQKATFNGKIYWFWESRFREPLNYFGPFVNRNHFAGWMILALSLGTGFFLGNLATTGRRIKPAWRERVLWLGSKEASSILITGTVLVVMAISLVWTLSRSGIAGAILSLLILSITSIVRMRSRGRRGLAASCIALAIGTAVAWKGVDTLFAWYENTHTLEWRFALWHDSLAPLRDFFLLGSGLNTYGAVMLLYPQTDLTQHAQQAHNDYLQLAIEGGLLVIIPWSISAGMIIRRIVQRLRQQQDEMTWWIRLGAVAGICGIAVQEITDFSLQIPGVAVLFAVVVAIAIHEPAPLAIKHERLSRVRV